MNRYRATVEENGCLFTSNVTVEELGARLFMEEHEVKILKDVFDGTYLSKKSLRDSVIHANRLLKNYNVSYNDTIPDQEYISVQYTPYKHYFHWIINIIRKYL